MNAKEDDQLRGAYQTNDPSWPFLTLPDQSPRGRPLAVDLRPTLPILMITELCLPKSNCIPNTATNTSEQSLLSKRIWNAAFRSTASKPANRDK